MGDFVKNNLSVSDITSYNALFGMSLVDLVMRLPEARGWFLSKLNLIQASDEVYIDISKGFTGFPSGIDYMMS